MSRFIALGVSPSRIFVSGNLKFDTLPSAILSKEEKLALRREMGFDKESRVLHGSSTWPREEKMLIDAMNRQRGAEPKSCNASANSAGPNRKQKNSAEKESARPSNPLTASAPYWNSSA